MRVRTTLVLTLAGLITAAGVAVPVLASADTPDPATTSVSCPAQDRAAYLQAHPDVAAEVATLAALPADQRPAARRAYLAANPDVAAALGTLHDEVLSRLAPLAALPDSPSRAELRAALRELRSDARSCRTGG